MPNRIAGCIYHHLQNLRRGMQLHISDNVKRYQSQNIARPFNIHPTVELRAPTKIKAARFCTIKAGTILNGRSDAEEFGISLGEYAYFKEYCYIDAYGGHISVGRGCAFAQYTMLHGGGGVTIGDHVIFGPNCAIIASNHNFRSREYPIMLQGDNSIGITIGDNVWVGAGAIILDGVNIGNNCVIAAGTIVKRDLSDGSIVHNEMNRIDRRIW